MLTQMRGARRTRRSLNVSRVLVLNNLPTSCMSSRLTSSSTVAASLASLASLASALKRSLPSPSWSIAVAAGSSGSHPTCRPVPMAYASRVSVGTALVQRRKLNLKAKFAGGSFHYSFK